MNMRMWVGFIGFGISSLSFQTDFAEKNIPLEDFQAVWGESFLLKIKSYRIRVWLSSPA
jgi:hypothetical protein